MAWRGKTGEKSQLDASAGATVSRSGGSIASASWSAGRPGRRQRNQLGATLRRRRHGTAGGHPSPRRTAGGRSRAGLRKPPAIGPRAKYRLRRHRMEPRMVVIALGAVVPAGRLPAASAVRTQGTPAQRWLSRQPDRPASDCTAGPVSPPAGAAAARQDQEEEPCGWQESRGLCRPPIHCILPKVKRMPVWGESLRGESAAGRQNLRNNRQSRRRPPRQGGGRKGEGRGPKPAGHPVNGVACDALIPSNRQARRAAAQPPRRPLLADSAAHPISGFRQDVELQACDPTWFALSARRYDVTDRRKQDAVACSGGGNRRRFEPRSGAGSSLRKGGHFLTSLILAVRPLGITPVDVTDVVLEDAYVAACPRLC